MSAERLQQRPIYGGLLGEDGRYALVRHFLVGR
jgi:hypothetical protein